MQDCCLTSFFEACLKSFFQELGPLSHSLVQEFLERVICSLGLFTDVSCVYTANPRTNPDAKPLCLGRGRTNTGTRQEEFQVNEYATPLKIANPIPAIRPLLLGCGSAWFRCLCRRKASELASVLCPKYPTQLYVLSASCCARLLQEPRLRRGRLPDYNKAR